MLPWMATPGPVTPPAQSRQSAPVYVAAPPAASTIPACRSARLSSASVSSSSTCCAVRPWASRSRPRVLYDRLGSDWVATAPTCARAAGTAAPTAKNFEATATPHDSPSSDRATIENVMARTLSVLVAGGVCEGRSHQYGERHASWHADRRRRLSGSQRGHPGGRAQGRRDLRLRVHRV